MEVEQETQIRWMIRADLPSVVRIENLSFEFPWTEEEFIDTLKINTFIGMVVEQGDRIVGYMVYQLHKTALEVVNLAVDPDSRMAGVGGSMLKKLKGKLHPEARTDIYTCVREANLGAQLFLKSLEFQCLSVEPGFYEDCDEAGYVFNYSIFPKKVFAWKR